MAKWHQLGNLFLWQPPSHRHAIAAEAFLHILMAVCSSMRALARASNVQGPCQRLWAVHQQLRMFGVCRRASSSSVLATGAAATPGRAGLACTASAAATDAAPSSSKQKVGMRCVLLWRKKECT